ncbi:MAG: DUF3135 domain-containing protein [Gammaproteobacteria bacterium]|nr:DUF3135 domain-containing protein [Gammaproteobacteria bacterium]
MSSEDDPEIVQDFPDNLEDLSFDEWCDLHQSDPRRFDIYRLKVLNDLIDSAPEESKPRLRGLMFRMEGESRRCKSQLGYNLRLSSMMMEMLDEMQAQIHLLCAADINELNDQALNPASAEVIPFNAAGKADDPNN